MAELPTIFRRRAKDALKRAPRFFYAHAGKNAPAEVKLALARFRALPEKVRAQIPAWGWLLGGGTPPLKMDKADVQYGPPPADRTHQRCSNCNRSYQHVGSGTFICDWVRGSIAPQAWCNRWMPVMQRDQYVSYQEGPP